MKPASQQSKIIEIGETRFALDDFDRAGRDEPPLVFLHGAVQTRHVWDGQAKVFADERRVIVPDLRGHGETAGPFEELAIEAHARDMIALLDALGIERAFICGVSLGGMVALSMSSLAPSRIAGLILADTPLALSLTGPVRRAVEWLGPQRILWPFFRLFGRRRTARLGLTLARLLLGWKWVGRAAGDHFVDGFSQMPPEAIVATYAAVVAADPVTVEIADKPCLVILGKHETSVVVSHAGEIARRLGRAEITFVEGGHVPNIDAPEEFNQAVKRFLGQAVCG
ncbi:alpha/beta hydrolase [Fulvimarina sp. MAC8]|uniref:alpha/beta fold hydrolase n=1 Tax=Fulvimarina sp. MAC8 TaxID=3162874 RepID=UPI0032EAF6EF